MHWYFIHYVDGYNIFSKKENTHKKLTIKTMEQKIKINILTRTIVVMHNQCEWTDRVLINKISEHQNTWK